MGTVRYTVVNGQVVAENRNGVRKTYVPDPSGSTIALLDDKQKITDTFSYSPFGELKSRTGTTPTPFQYIGTRGYYTNPSNRVYVRARTYQSSYARWMTVDPLWPGESAYGYARNNPVRWGDPSGNFVFEGCTPREETALRGALALVCSRCRKFDACTCLNCPRIIVDCCATICHNPHFPIQCGGDPVACSRRACAAGQPRKIIVCPPIWTPDCDHLHCVLAHELIHTCGQKGHPAHCFACVKDSWPACR